MIHFLPNLRHTRLVLTQAREIIEDPEHWVKEYIHRGEAFCANGACFEVGVPISRFLNNSKETILGIILMIYVEALFPSHSGF